jgi:hypothetical protein
MIYVANSKETRICAFCRFWYDPTNSAIKPKMGDFFEYDDTVEKPCSKNGNLPKPAWAGCGEFEPKF